MHLLEKHLQLINAEFCVSLGPKHNDANAGFQWKTRKSRVNNSMRQSTLIPVFLFLICFMSHTSLSLSIHRIISLVIHI